MPTTTSITAAKIAALPSADRATTLMSIEMALNAVLHLNGVNDYISSRCNNNKGIVGCKK